MFSFVTRLMRSAGYSAIAVLMFVENVFPPIPSELIMPLAGFMTRRGELALLLVIIAGTIGSVAGAVVLYYLGRAVGEARVRRWVASHGKWLAMSEADVENAQKWFGQYGARAVFFGRLVPAVRSLISIPAGIARMNLAEFLIFTTLGSAIWTALLAGAGWALGSQYQRVEKFIGPASNVIVSAMLVFYVLRVIKLHRQSA
jgi:membrane protein DedA with SNARE-associated domain